MIILIQNIKLGSPANRALEHAGIKTIDQLIDYSEKDLLALHGFGPKALEILKTILSDNGLQLKED